MARVVVAEHAGTCFGVQRALELIEQTLAKEPQDLCTLGPVIHNPQVVADLERRGVRVVQDVAELTAGETLVLRTHGVHPGIERRADELGIHTVDATCPFVKKVHKAVERLKREGYQVVIVGEVGHPEVEGTRGHAQDALVIGSVEEARAIQIERRVGLVVQTTLALSTLSEVVGALLGRCEELRLINTICSATAERQEAAAKLAAQADVMVVVGGRNSANTTHLAEICQRACEATHHIESATELDASWFANAKLVGITAGASTPVSQINEVVQHIA